MEESVLSANQWRNVIIPHAIEDAYCSEKVANYKNSDAWYFQKLL